MKIEGKVIDNPSVTITITMSMREAQAFKTILGGVAGEPTGPRQVTEGIYRYLGDMGIKGAVMPTPSYHYDTWEDLENNLF